MGAIIGKCRFEGNRPSNCLNYGTLQVYHNGTVKKTGSRGGENVWKGSGDVWVIYKNKGDVGNPRMSVPKFLINGRESEGKRNLENYIKIIEAELKQ